VPSFAFAGSDFLLLARLVSVSATALVFGSLVFNRCLSPVWPLLDAATEARFARVLARFVWWGVAFAAVSLAAWFWLQTADLADAADFASVLRAVPTVAGRTWFGAVLLAQLGLLLLTALGFGRRQRFALAFWPALASTLAQVAHGHAVAMEGLASVLAAISAVHIVAASAWLGSLAPLFAFAAVAPPREAALAARWYSPMGQWCLAALVFTAAWQGWVEIGSIPALLGTGFGWMALVKLALFGALSGFAWVNRYRFAPALRGVAPWQARRALLVSLGGQTLAGLAILLAAVLLSSLPPGMHTEPVWPFAWQISLDAAREDADYASELWRALAIAGLCLAALAAASLRLRWFRLPAAAGALVVALWAWPHLGPLFVPADAFSFYHSPSGFSAESVLRGEALYPSLCASCHGEAGRGDGTAAAGLPLPPADLTALHLWYHSDGQLFGWIRGGIEAPRGGLAMPGFALPDDDIWALIDFLRARNAGLAADGRAAWPVPVAAPDAAVACASGESGMLSDRRGSFVRLVFGRQVSGEALSVSPGIPAKGCAVVDDAAPAAFALVLGIPPGRLAGVQVLIGPEGFLRDVDTTGAWNDPAALAAVIAGLRAHPLQGAGAMPMMNMKM
jgi:putative copper export protein/mono/diheme cytochrome c family protein